MSQIVDLTLKFRNNMPVQDEFPRPVYVSAMTSADSGSLGLGTSDDPFIPAWKYLAMVEHTGTHVDAFSHMKPGAASIDEMPLEMFYGRAICFDMTHIPDKGEIQVSDLEEAQERTGVTVDGHIVLLNTGVHSRHYPTRAIFDVNPGISAEATHWLADHGSRLHGVEGPSTDVMSTGLFPSHRVCRDRNISHYEWLVNLEHLVGKGEFTFYGVPLNLDGGTGSPVRAFAVVDE